MKFKYYFCIAKGILTGFYKIERCPVCNHLYLGENTICHHCGYEYEWVGSQEVVDLFLNEYYDNMPMEECKKLWRTVKEQVFPLNK